MAFRRIYEHTSVGSYGTAHGKITIKSNGWSGNVVKADREHNTFQFDCSGSVTYAGDSYELSASGGYVTGDSGYIVGISLEHMGEIREISSNQMNIQFLGMDNNEYDLLDYVPAWGALENDSELTLLQSLIFVEEFIRNEATYSDLGISNITSPYIYSGIRVLLDGDWYAVESELEIETDLPIFETDADLLAYCRSGGQNTDNILNPSDEPTPEDEYNERFKYHYVNNIFGHNTRNASAYTGYRNYRFFPKSKRMCFYRVTPTVSNPYTVQLLGYDSSVVVKSAPAYGSNDDDYHTISGDPELYYLHKSISLGNNDYYTKFKFNTDLLVYGNESDAQDYIDGTGDPRLAENFNDVSRQYNEFVDPNYGDPDTGNDHGKNGINYSRGSTLWKLSETEMHTFFSDIFDTGNISDILSNTQLFGANQINSILGVAYYPFDVADVCRLDTSKKIYVGSWECPNATGKRVLFNYDLIDCGSISIPRVYNDYRDYEMEIYISLPYVGVHKLNTALYMGASSLHIYYAVDVSTGCCTAHLHVTNETLTDCEIDSWDGFISSMRPISAVDQQSYISGVMGNVTSIFNRETGMINDATQAVTGVMTGNVKGALASGVGPGYGFSQSAGAIGDLYGLSQSIRDVPISTRGGFSGALGMFGNQKIHIITAQKRKTVPDNKLLTVGLPSNIGGRVGLFSGFLSVSAFTMADGFTGTAEELREIETLMASGIFI